MNATERRQTAQFFDGDAQLTSEWPNSPDRSVVALLQALAKVNPHSGAAGDWGGGGSQPYPTTITLPCNGSPTLAETSLSTP